MVWVLNGWDCRAISKVQPFENRTNSNLIFKKSGFQMFLSFEWSDFRSPMYIESECFFNVDIFLQISGQAPLAPELAMKEQLHAQKREDLIKKDITAGKQKKKDKEKRMELLANVDISDDPVHNDFKRELLFYRQAQSAVLEALPRLKSMKIPTKRPQDYFAQMAKTDEHMQKVFHLTLGAGPAFIFTYNFGTSFF